MRAFWAGLPAPVRQGVWFVGLWAAGVLTVTLVAFIIRLMIL